MTENLKQNVNLPLTVELGRLPVTLQQIGELQKGQVLQMTQSPGDPVDLIISGKSIGQGELLEVEGKFGVKIISLIGA